MPPKPDRKEKPVKGDDAEKVNRPYASTDVSANLKNRVTKTEAQKALNALAEKGSLTLKPYGKQTIFVYNQASHLVAIRTFRPPYKSQPSSPRGSQLSVLDPEEMIQLDNQLKKVKSALDERRKELKLLQSEIASLEAQPKTKELSDAISEVAAGNELIFTALKAFREESAAAPMSPKDTAKIDADWDRWRKEWTSRKKVYRDLYGMLTDCGMASGSQADFEEEQGIDNDDDETKAVEAGEFCHPVGHGSGKRKQPSSGGSTGRTISVKRTRT